MTRCVEFYQKYKKDPEFRACTQSAASESEINKYLNFVTELEGHGVEEVFAFANLSENAVSDVPRPIEDDGGLSFRLKVYHPTWQKEYEMVSLDHDDAVAYRNQVVRAIADDLKAEKTVTATRVSEISEAYKAKLASVKEFHTQQRAEEKEREAQEAKNKHISGIVDKAVVDVQFCHDDVMGVARTAAWNVIKKGKNDAEMETRVPEARIAAITRGIKKEKAARYHVDDEKVAVLTAKLDALKEDNTQSSAELHELELPLVQKAALSEAVNWFPYTWHWHDELAPAWQSPRTLYDDMHTAVRNAIAEFIEPLKTVAEIEASKERRMQIARDVVVAFFTEHVPNDDRRSYLLATIDDTNTPRPDRFGDEDAPEETPEQKKAREAQEAQGKKDAEEHRRLESNKQLTRFAIERLDNLSLPFQSKPSVFASAIKEYTEDAQKSRDTLSAARDFINATLEILEVAE